MRRLAAVLAVFAAGGWALAATSPEAVRRKEAGNQYLKERRYEEARDQYLAALKADPTYSDAHYNLGVVYFFRLRDYPRALYHFTRYAELSPEATDTGQVQSLVFQALEKIETAERDAYARALLEGTPAAIQSFIEAHPRSTYLRDGTEKLDLLRKYEDEVRARDREAQSAWDEALAAGTPEAMDAFLERHPKAPRAEEGRRLRDMWVRQRTETKALDEALTRGSVQDLERFLAEYPESALVPRARMEIERLSAAEEAYKIAAQSQSIPALEVFLATYAGTRRAPEARALLDALRKEEAERVAREKAEAEAREREAREREEAARRDEALRQEEAAKKAWEEAERENTPEGYADFARAHPGHPMAAEAVGREARLRAAEAAKKAPTPPPAAPSRVDQDWAEAERENTPEGYEKFLRLHPQADQAESARGRLEELRRAVSDDESQLPAYKRKALDQYRKMLEGR